MNTKSNHRAEIKVGSSQVGEILGSIRYSQELGWQIHAYDTANASMIWVEDATDPRDAAGRFYRCAKDGEWAPMSDIEALARELKAIGEATLPETNVLVVNSDADDT